MKKSQIEYMCFCLFVIVVCVLIITFTSRSDLKMSLVSDDLDNYLVEHAPSVYLPNTSTKKHSVKVATTPKGPKGPKAGAAHHVVTSKYYKNSCSEEELLHNKFKDLACMKSMREEDICIGTAGSGSSYTASSERTESCPHVKDPFYMNTMSWSGATYPTNS